MGKKSILVRLDEDLYDDIHKVMGYTLISDGITIDKMHIGQHQDFYRKLVMRGLAQLKKEWDEKVKKYESQDSH